MKKESLACGDVVIVSEYGEVFEAIIIAHGTNNQPLVVKTEDLKMDCYNPTWITYEGITKILDYVDIKKALLEKTNMEEVKVYFDCLDGDKRGDLVRCVDCGELMLIQLGGTACGECESENLMWYDEDRPEWDIEELEEAGFIIIEK